MVDDVPPRFPRRAFLRAGFAATTLRTEAAAPAGQPAATGEAPFSGSAHVDVNVHLGAWPFRRLPYDDPAAFAQHLRSNGVTEAWCGSFEALLHREPGGVNERLAKDCASLSGSNLDTRPVGVINPALPGWRRDLEHCAGRLGMRAIRIYPNYHGYTLADPRFTDLLEAAANQNLVIQIVAQMEDQRTQHPLVRVPPVDLAPLAAALEKAPAARIMVLNASRTMSMTALRGVPVWLDIAMLEGVGGIANLLADGWPADRVVFGSHAPFFYLESALLKLKESGLTRGQWNAICHKNVPA